MLYEILDPIRARLGGLGNRAMFWACHRESNFGDWLGPYIYEKRTGIKPVYVKSKHRYLGKLLFTVGSILHHIKRPNQAVVWGSGIIHREFNFAAPQHLRVHCTLPKYG